MIRLKNIFKGKEINKEPDDTILIDSTTSCYEVEFGNFIKIGKYSFLYKCTISDFTYLAGSSSIMNTNIGKFCSIAEGVKIGNGIHPVKDFVSTHPIFFFTL